MAGLLALGVVAVLGRGAALGAAAPTPGGPDRFTWRGDTYVIWPQLEDAPDQAAVVSWSDWMVFDHAIFGDPGVRFILNEMAASGIRTVWWRTFGGGWALYPSHVDGVTTGNYPGQGADYSQYDSLADAVEYGHKLGLKVYAWYTPLEEAHGWPDNVRSHYVDAHRDQWDMSEAGVTLGAPSFYYDEYRQYKADLAREMIGRYDVDGLVIDLGRRGSPGRTDSWGYLPPIVSAFHRETGLDPRDLPNDDPRWQRFRARYVGLFMRDVRDAVDDQDRDVELVMMFPADQPLSAHWDARGWAERGWIDAFALVAHGKEGWGSPADQTRGLVEEYRDLDRPLSLAMYALKGDRATIAHRTRRAIASGFDDIVWFETTYLHFKNIYDVPRSFALPMSAQMQSPPIDLTGGGEVAVLAAGDWTMRIGGDVVATGAAAVEQRVTLPPRPGLYPLVISCELPDRAPRAGAAVQGWAIDDAGKRHAIRTDASWHAIDGDGGAVGVVTVAQPGVPPFLGEVDVDG